LSNSIAAGSWDRHDSTPANVSWSTNTLDYAGSITSATWNGNTVSVNRGGTGATTLTGYVKGSGTSALTANATIPTTDLSGTITNAQLANSSITINGNNTSLGGSVSVGTVTSVAATAGTGISVTGSPITSSGTLNITNTAPDQTVVLTAGTGISTSGTYPNFTITNTSPSSGGTVTSVTGTAPISSSGGNTPAISISQATTSTNGYLSSTDWNTFNNKGSGSVTSVAATVPSFLSVTGSPITTSGTLAISYSGTALPILNGGTGQTTANAAFNALAPSQTSNSGKYLTTDGTNTSWVSQSNAYTRTSFTATVGQTTFTVSYTVGYIQVYVNGVLLNASDYTASNGTSVVLAQGRATGDIVEVIAFATGTVTPTNLSVGTSLVQGGTNGYVLYNNSGVVGNLATTGSGSVVLGTSPTIATPTLTTPTITSLYGQNSNLVTTPYRDSGLIPAELIYRLNTAYVGTATTSAQSFLGVGVTVSGSTVYQFEGLFAVSKTATASLHNLQLGFGGTATLNNISYIYYQPISTITGFNDTNGAVYTGFIQTASATTIATPSTTASIFKTVFIKGTVSINAGGTFIPQYTTSVSVGPYTTAIGSYFKLSPMSASGANTSIGTWA
jgi:hypothetical protein